MKIWLKMALGLGLVLLLVTAMGTMAVITFKNIDAQVTALAERFNPLSEIANRAQSRLKDQPVLMSNYMHTGNPTFWNQLEAVMTDTTDLAEKMAAATYHVEEVSNSDADRVKTTVNNFRTLLRNAHAVNEQFIANRGIMITAGSETYDAASKFKNSLQTQLQEACTEYDIPAIAALLPQVQAIDRVVDGITALRTRMLRSLAEQKKEYAQGNQTEYFPKTLEAVENIEKLQIDTAGREAAANLKKLITAYREHQNKTLELWDKNDAMTAQRDTMRTTLLEQMNAIATAGAKAENAVTNQIEEASTASITSTTTLSAVVVVLCILVSVLLTRAINVPVRRVLNFAQRVAGGELHQRLQMQRKDEFGQLSAALDSMVDALNEKIDEANQKSAEAAQKQLEAQRATADAEKARAAAETAKRDGMFAAAGQLEAVVGVVSSASMELSAQIAQSERGSAEQASRVAETATAMNEMNSTVLEVARNAGAASEVSASTRKKAETGAQVVHMAVKSIQTVQQQSMQLKSDMAELSQQAQAISQIMGVISDIADQTNLLALNAAIEAARAGEAGRGFAVVADEVRKLAEKTMASTTDVGNAIKAIQNSAGKSMDQMDLAVRSIEEATEYVNQSGTALQEIVTMVDNTADQVRAIATASEQQSASSEEINQSISHVNTITAETARAMQEAARAVSDLAAQAQVLTRLIDDMKRD